MVKPGSGRYLRHCSCWGGNGINIDFLPGENFSQEQSLDGFIGIMTNGAYVTAWIYCLPIIQSHFNAMAINP